MPLYYKAHAAQSAHQNPSFLTWKTLKNITSLQSPDLRIQMQVMAVVANLEYFSKSVLEQLQGLFQLRMHLKEAAVYQ